MVSFMLRQFILFLTPGGPASLFDSFHVSEPSGDLDLEL